jgi:hypothetical protein
VAHYVFCAQLGITFTKKVCLDKATKVNRMRQVQALPSRRMTHVLNRPMLNPLHRSAPLETKRMSSPAGKSSLSLCRETLRNINWRLIVFCVALWWFIYSAPTEGILTSHFWAASTATNSDDF